MMWKEIHWTPETYQSFREYLTTLADEKYRKFHQKIVPGCMTLLGVRMPQLRQLGKEIAQGDGRRFLSVAGHEIYEEVMLQGIVIGAMKSDIDTLLADVADFVPLISNWALCDCFVGGLKAVKRHRKQVRGFLDSYLQSEQPYDVRFAVVMLMDHFTEEAYLEDLFAVYDSVSHPDYYVRMAVAWAVSVAYVKFPAETMEYLKNCRLSDWTYQKALQKIIESRRVSEGEKQTIRGMKLRRSISS
ncbi:MAG: DNA alkylation repair protein [Bacillota bacterium]|nr:DNA alkylation repair protein [Bacillota bacterium]